MSIFKACMIAFSMYSKIPVPQFEWKEKDMRYVLCFFPWVGAIIGGISCLWFYNCRNNEVGTLCFTMIGTAIPLLITGGIHMDGYMDTMDAMHSYQPKEKKLEILKDPHIGAFSVLMLALYYLVYIGAYSEIHTWKQMGIVSCGFFLSRTLSGLGLVTLKSAKKEGLLYTFASQAETVKVRVVLIIQLVLVAALMLWISPVTGAAAVVCAALSFVWYRWKSYKEIDGITGDTAGWFLAICELCILAAAVLI